MGAFMPSPRLSCFGQEQGQQFGHVQGLRVCQVAYLMAATRPRRHEVRAGFEGH